MQSSIAAHDVVAQKVVALLLSGLTKWLNEYPRPPAVGGRGVVSRASFHRVCVFLPGLRAVCTGQDAGSRLRPRSWRMRRTPDGLMVTAWYRAGYIEIL